MHEYSIVAIAAGSEISTHVCSPHMDVFVGVAVHRVVSHSDCATAIVEEGNSNFGVAAFNLSLYR